MKISQEDVAYVAGLANLELTAEERQSLVRDLNSILGYIDRLRELDTTGVPPMAQTVLPAAEVLRNDVLRNDVPREDALRDDTPRPSLSHERALANAPDTDGDFFKVPKVIEK